MAFVCIPKDKIVEFRKALKNKEIDVAKLIGMETEARTAYFEKFAGENAKIMNSLFEEKLVLKNKLQGIKNWASKVGEVGRYDPAKKAKLDALMDEYKSKQQERMFNPTEDESFLKDLVEEKFGTRISREEAKTVFDSTQKVDDLKKNFDGKEWKTESDRTNYGTAKVALENYVKDLKTPDMSIKDMLKARGSEFVQTWGQNKALAVYRLGSDALKNLSNNTVSLVATLDNSFLGRQGLKALLTHPSKWWDGAKNSFVDIAKTLGGKNMEDALMADIYSKPNYMNGRYDLAKLIPKSEEQFPTSLPEKIWGVGRVFSASEVAFKGSAIRMRTGLFDLISDMAEKNGLEMSDTQVKDIGRLVNSMTAKGALGKIGESGVVKLVLWAPRMLKANLDALTAHTFGAGLETSFARKQAAINLLKIVGATATIMTISNAVKKDSAELDPRSSNFGKLKFGNTTFDITGGASSLVVLAARIATGMSKSTATGVVSPFGTGYGQTTRFDALVNFLTGKTTPLSGEIIRILQGKEFGGQAPTVGSALYGMFTPISIQNVIGLKDDSSASAVAGVLLDALGVNAQTNIPKTDWSMNMTKELQSFKDRVGEGKFNQANDEFNRVYNNWLNATTANPKYQELSDKEKQKSVTKTKQLIKEAIIRKYQ